MSTAATLDETEVLTQATSSRFESLLQHLIGEPFLFLTRGYGEELILHFGERAFGPVRQTKHGSFRYEHGTFSLHLRGSAWLMKSGITDSLLTGGMDSEFIRALGEPVRRATAVTECPISTGAVSTAMRPFLYTRPPVDGIGLRVDMSDGSSIVAIPTSDEPDPLVDAPADAKVFGLADWELRTTRFTLEVGPGRKWHVGPTAISE
jgi:hypothetical protein